MGPWEYMLDGRREVFALLLLMLWAIGNMVAIYEITFATSAFDQYAVYAVSWLSIPLLIWAGWSVRWPGPSKYNEFVAAPASWLALLLPAAGTLWLCYRGWQCGALKIGPTRIKG